MKIAVIGQFSTTVEAVRAIQRAGHNVEVVAPRDQVRSFSNHGINRLVANVNYIDSIDSDETLALFKKMAPDAILSVVFGNKIPQQIVDVAPEGAFNFHPAKLPEFRSGNAWFWPVRMGVRYSALTIHRLSQQWDSGNIVWEREFEVGANDTQGIYVERVNSMVPDFFYDWVQVLESRNLPEHVQNSDGVHYYPKIKCRDIMINWSETAQSIFNLTRACNPYHFAQTIFKNSAFEVVECEITDRKSKGAGEITVEGDQLFIGTADFDIRIKVLKFFEFGTFSAKRLLALFPLVTGDKAKNLAEDSSVQGILDDILS